MMKKGFKDVYTGSFLFVFSLIMYFYVIPHHIKAYAVYGLPPSFFPKVVTAALGIFSFIQMISGLKQSRKDVWSIQILKEQIKGIDIKPVKNVALIFGLSVLYYFGLKYTGFLITTPIMIILLGLAFRWKKYGVLFLLSLITTALLYLIFGIILGSPLP